MRILFLTVLASVGLWIILSRSVRAPDFDNARREIIELQTAQIDFYSRHGRYAASIAELAPELPEGQKDGYHFSIAAQGNSYTIRAEPLYPSARTRTLYSDETLVIQEIAPR